MTATEYWRRLHQGFLTKEYMTAIEELGVPHPDMCMMNTLQHLIYNTVTDLVWQERNEIMHRSKNKYNAIEDARLLERINWYVEHRHELVDHHDQFPAEIDLTRPSDMRHKKQQKWVYHLDIAMGAWKIEREQRKENQSVITSFFQRQNDTQ